MLISESDAFWRIMFAKRWDLGPMEGIQPNKTLFRGSYTTRDWCGKQRKCDVSDKLGYPRMALHEALQDPITIEFPAQSVLMVKQVPSSLMTFRD